LLEKQSTRNIVERAGGDVAVDDTEAPSASRKIAAVRVVVANLIFENLLNVAATYPSGPNQSLCRDG
jgi:hypothetical protein